MSKRKNEDKLINLMNSKIEFNGKYDDIRNKVDTNIEEKPFFIRNKYKISIASLAIIIIACFIVVISIISGNNSSMSHDDNTNYNPKDESSNSLFNQKISNVIAFCDEISKEDLLFLLDEYNANYSTENINDINDDNDDTLYLFVIGLNNNVNVIYYKGDSEVVLDCDSAITFNITPEESDTTSGDNKYIYISIVNGEVKYSYVEKNTLNLK